MKSFFLKNMNVFLFWAAIFGACYLLGGNKSLAFGLIAFALIHWLV